ncbi:hypothetical protein ACHAXA_002135 [Cyclostephanos tholiformis]|uniref:t-SNARE coiled-coil homology domain-containing protein n=1 Tax=Cyclostephanos tholiformis TaxID=382380 RepID=A0ABD3RU68_9STRA
MAAVLTPSTHGTNSNDGIHPTHRCQPSPATAVDRSLEFLSAARTALRISQRRRDRRRRQRPDDDDDDNDYDDDVDDDGIPPLPEWLMDLDPADLNLYRRRHPPSSSAYARDGREDGGGHGRRRFDDDAPTLVGDAEALLRLLDSHLSDLSSLVRRRGHTNDPTIEIQGLMERFQEGAREVKDVCDSLRMAGTRPPRGDDDGGGGGAPSSSQRRRHYEMLSMQLEAQARERTDALRGILETRSRVLRDQSHRRKLLAGGGVGYDAAIPKAGGGGMTQHRPVATRLPAQINGSASSQFQSPLFTATSDGRVGAGAATSTAMGKSPSSSLSSYPAYAGYGGSAMNGSAPAAGVGYGGASMTISSALPPGMGMRHRRHQHQDRQSKVQICSGGGDEYDDKYNKSSMESSSMQHQISQRRERRATHARAQQARLAERSIAELGVMFTKMSTLISQQGEVLERIEDDVEAAGMDIDAGHDELVKVYGMTKGNRGLILKVFGILIFLIIFMKFY